MLPSEEWGSNAMARDADRRIGRVGGASRASRASRGCGSVGSNRLWAGYTRRYDTGGSNVAVGDKARCGWISLKDGRY